MLYSPYYPLKDHDALCMTVKRADESTMVNCVERQANVGDFSSIYPGAVIIN